MKRRPFEIDLAMKRIREAVRPYPKAGLFELYDEGFTSPFELLIACIISIRTYDEVMLPVYAGYSNLDAPHHRSVA